MTLNGYEIQIMDASVFAKYKKAGRRGYICRVTKDVRAIDPVKCRMWFNKNRVRYGTKRFIMLVPKHSTALMLHHRFSTSNSFVGIPVRIISAEEAKEAAPEYGVNRFHALAVI